MMNKYNRKFKSQNPSPVIPKHSTKSQQTPNKSLMKKKTNIQLSIEKMTSKERGDFQEEEQRLEAEKIKLQIFRKNSNLNRTTPRVREVFNTAKNKIALCNKRSSLVTRSDDEFTPRKAQSPELCNQDRFNTVTLQRKGMTPNTSEIRVKKQPTISTKLKRKGNSEKKNFTSILKNGEINKSNFETKVPPIAKLKIENYKIPRKGDTNRSFFNINSKTSYISEESFSNSQDSDYKMMIKRAKNSSITKRFINHSERRPNKNVTFYTDMLKPDRLKGYTSRSVMGKRKLKLTERAQQSLVESRKHNLQGLFKKNKRIGSLFHTIIDNKSQPPSTSASENIPKINVGNLNSESINDRLSAFTLDTSLLSKESKRRLNMGRRKSVSIANGPDKDKGLTKFIKKDLNAQNIDKKLLTHNSDMTLYEEYLHLLLIKTSDKFIRDRYQSYINKINMGKERRQTFFQRMEKDIVVREENMKEMIDNQTVSRESFISKPAKKPLVKRKTIFIRDNDKAIEVSDMLEKIE
mmetsp:Transcript_22515/g.22319  ORF Transcript_22515/g.22319 Transcript_22515/m.22319 type:complete len:521 (-) Transcript_22515:19-1581(-)|eukprot:CAMPEP_0196999554 /NCGR_PEP_ID=MMETSP1380-20130617/4709_1 /TAXON_ID=5936 /ORGANISM="Euplotes crassus, Strain CT5" /LENGTH=520 /DNA_ID=CAMNT_0042416517 /DNA_START=312 /DNA_END=1874 /DNA_ORIENTATION=-